MLITLRVPDDAVGIKYYTRGEDGFSTECDVTMGMIVRVEHEENEGGKEHE